ncbi:hypothetical protein [Kitasatospora sp. NPDC047058]|uniref:hypothetical protein n=1 Tax=Kitasatospora sp. NPDC047058 TaxID=3155620 RepID=UPI0033F11492
MTLVTDTAVKALLTTTTTTQVRPRYEGSNICTWIGFKHVNYLVEEAVLDHFRQSALPARALYEEHGLGLDLVSIDTRILHAFHMDDLATAEVAPWTKDADGTIGLKVTIRIERGGEILKAVTSKVRVSLRIDTYLEAAGTVPEQLARFAVALLGDDLEREPATAAPAEEEILAALTAGRNAYAWKWNIPYPYCHFTERIQMSGYLRLMEEGKDRFVADRGISIKTLLDDRKWIPVVPRSDIRVLDEALMEEDLYTVYTVEEVFKDFTYTSRMDFYVLRGGELVKTATGRIVHGYAVIGNRRDWSLVSFDQRVLDAVNGVPAA